MSNKYQQKPKHKGYISAIQFNCDYCGKINYESRYSFLKKKRHFCNKKCYSQFRKDLLPKEEQNAYGSGYSLAERILRKKCREILNHAIRDGKIKKQSCKICNKKKTEAHHPDYTRPLEVEWYCFKHHRQVHENPELMEVRR